MFLLYYLFCGFISTVLLSFCNDSKMDIRDYMTLLFIGPLILFQIILWMFVDGIEYIKEKIKKPFDNI